jgi:hypothetical protein
VNLWQQIYIQIYLTDEWPRRAKYSGIRDLNNFSFCSRTSLRLKIGCCWTTNLRVSFDVNHQHYIMEMCRFPWLSFTIFHVSSHFS